MQFFDLSRPIQSGMAVLPGDPAVVLMPTRSHDADGYAVTEVRLGTHSGTHIDAPRHFFADGSTLDQFPIERFVGPALLLDCSRGDPGTHIDGASLAEHIARYEALPPGGIILLRTAGRLLSLEAAQVLAERQTGMVGSDTASLDREPYEVHTLLLGRDILLLENLWGLEKIEPGPLTCACLPLPLTGCDGAPARVVAWRP